MLNFFFKLKKSPKRKKTIVIKIIICLKLTFIDNKIKKACSSVAERTAHNGLVVGSIPTKPKIFLIKNGNNIKNLSDR